MGNKMSPRKLQVPPLVRKSEMMSKKGNQVIPATQNGIPKMDVCPLFATQTQEKIPVAEQVNLAVMYS
jgi:hypothetical protein